MARSRLSIRVDLASGLRIGSGKVSLLETIRSTGSLPAAARSLEMSYRRAWLLVEEINNGLHESAVTAASGGQKSGCHGARGGHHRSLSLHRIVGDISCRHQFRALGALARRETSAA
jgi:molybdate transport system regulatory protein